MSMSSFPLPDNPNITNAAEKPGQTEHSTVRFLSITPSQAQGPAGPEPGLQAILDQAMQRTARPERLLFLAHKKRRAAAPPREPRLQKWGRVCMQAAALPGFVLLPAKSLSATIRIQRSGWTPNCAK